MSGIGYEVCAHGI